MKKLLVGGTHGNEWTGIYLLENMKSSSLFEAELLANPEAFKQNKRFVDEDLNRCFSKEKRSNPSGVLERERAIEIHRIIENFDLVLDCHTTTSNMGNTLIFTRKTKEMFHLIQFIKKKVPYIKVLFHADPDEQYLISHCKLGIVVEVGPVANSTLNPKIFEETKMVAEAVGQWQGEESTETEIEYYEYAKTIPYSFNQEGKLNSMVHPKLQDADFKELQETENLLVDLELNDISFSGLKGLYPIFINEAAYYKYEYAMQLVEKKTWKLAE
jgi:aspartoacylase